MLYPLLQASRQRSTRFNAAPLGRLERNVEREEGRRFPALCPVADHEAGLLVGTDTFSSCINSKEAQSTRLHSLSANFA
jgi:hypothetical protein